MSVASRRPPTVPPDAGLEELYRQEAPWLLRQLRRRFGRSLPHLLDDLVQDTFLRAAQADVTSPRHPRAFLLTVASRLAINAARRQRRIAEITGAFPEPAPEESGAEETHLLKQVILDMPALYRDVFVLARFRGLTYPQIAEALGVSVKTVEWRMGRALSHCAACLRR